MNVSVFKKITTDPQNKMLYTFLSEELNNKATSGKGENTVNSLFFCSIYYPKAVRQGFTLHLTKLAYFSPCFPRVLCLLIIL